MYILYSEQYVICITVVRGLHFFTYNYIKIRLNHTSTCMKYFDVKKRGKNVTPKESNKQEQEREECGNKE